MVMFQRGVRVGLVSRFRRANGGNVAMIFALTFSTILMITGFAIDFQRSSSFKQQVQDMADQATLAAVGQNAVFDGTNYKYDATKSTALAKAFFEANLKASNLGSSVTFTPTYNSVVNGASVTTTISYSGSIKTLASGIFGLTDIKFDGKSVSNSATPNYIDVVIVVDTSSSMLMGASDADQLIMLNTNGCYLTCHGGEDYWHNQGVVFRLDVVKSAIASMVDEFKSAALLNEQYRISIYGFNNSIYNILPATTSYAVAKTAASNIEGTTAGTNSSYSLARLLTLIPPAGDGSSVDSRQQFVVLFTDGSTNALLPVFLPNGTFVEWVHDPNFKAFAPTAADWVQTQGFNPADCEPLKANKVSVMTLNTTYVIRPEETDPRSLFIKNNLLSNIEKNLRTCASQPDFAFVANDAAQIKAATKALAKTLISSAHITQ